MRQELGVLFYGGSVEVPSACLVLVFQVHGSHLPVQAVGADQFTSVLTPLVSLVPALTYLLHLPPVAPAVSLYPPTSSCCHPCNLTTLTYSSIGPCALV